MIHRPSWLHSDLGAVFLGDAVEILPEVPPSSVSLVLSSPPFGLSGVCSDKKPANSVAEWLLSFMDAFQRILKPGGSLVLEFGSTWLPSVDPRRSTDNLEFISWACREGGWSLLQTFYWYNPDLLHSPVEWIELQPVRFRECISPVWWLSKTPDRIEVNTRSVAEFYSAEYMPPGNLLHFTDTEFDRDYRERCTKASILPHVDPFPTSFAKFFISLLTKEGDMVLDPFSGSCTTGATAQGLSRRWICIEACEALIESASFRFNSSELLGDKTHLRR